MKTRRLVIALAVTAATALVAGAFIFKHAGHQSRAAAPLYSANVVRYTAPFLAARNVVHNTAPSLAASGNFVGALAARTGMMMSKATDHGVVGRGASAVHLTTAPTSSGGSCLLSDSAAGPAAMCLDSPTLFAQRPVAYLVQSDGGPTPANIQYLRVVGVVGARVDAVAVVLTSGTTQSLVISSKRAFGYEAPLDRIHAGDLPTKLIAYQDGTAIETFPLRQ